jgi:transcriptional regulator with XRE-family HTH domain
VPPWRTIRRTKGLNLETVADAANIDAGHLSRIERGLAHPTIPVAYRLAKALGLAPLTKALSPFVEAS